MQTREITPGGMKAKLILATGKNVLLDTLALEVTTIWEAGATIQKSGGVLTYENVGKEDARPMEVVYNTLEVPRGGEYDVVLEDGTRVWLNADSRLKYPVVFPGSERRVILEGEAYFKVKREENRPFSVEMGGNCIEVLGTEFNVRYYPEENKQITTLVSGKVKFISEGNKSLVLSPGEQAVLTHEGILSCTSVDVTLYTAWKDGNFVFRKQRLEEVLKTLARWYDVDVFYEDVSRKDVEFTGNIERFERFEEIIDLLRMTGDTDFEVKGKNIFVRCK